MSDTTKKAGGGVKGAVGKLTGRKKGEAEEEKPEEEFDEGEEEERRGTSTDKGARSTTSSEKADSLIRISDASVCARQTPVHRFYCLGLLGPRMIGLPVSDARPERV